MPHVDVAIGGSVSSKDGLPLWAWIVIVVGILAVACLVGCIIIVIVKKQRKKKKNKSGTNIN